MHKEWRQKYRIIKQLQFVRNRNELINRNEDNTEQDLVINLYKPALRI
ncbi:unnamed protein product [Paramecium octaurelia]|uniref:Uncharacterized protein n=1 Tax=Paramecium octaurelia TaxID=43137 RepID=A0A8S1XR03_PAROT|nr:unnamed protein product [Paramecium octaurelia]